MDYNREKFYREYVQREDNFKRAPYNPEIEFYTTIKTGDINKLKKLLEKEKFEDKPGLGRLSDDPLQNLKYHFVITTALTARYCIQGGMELSTAYGLSDFYIQKADRCKNVEDLAALHPDMCIDYAKNMKKIAMQSICSQPIVKCIDYIYENLHARITVEALAAHLKLSPSYLSRLFKKEVGVSISSYISSKKLETAKNMLLYSEFRPAEIASILAYPSQSYFTEIFKKETGHTPTAYRKNNGGEA